MKYSKLCSVLLLSFLLLMLSACGTTSVNENADVTLTFIYSDKNISVALPRSESEKVAEILDGNLYDKNRTTLILHAAGKADTHFEIPNTVTQFGYGVFYTNQLTTVIIPNKIKLIPTGWTNIVYEVEAEDGPAEYYTISGVRVAEPVDGGVTIERRGSKVVKKIY